MPLHEYKCKKCGFEFEELVSTEDAKIVCWKCGGEVDQRMSAFSSVVEGSESVDVRIGKEAEKRWEIHKNRQDERRSGKDFQPVVTPKTADGKYMPVMALGTKKEREKRGEYATALQEHREERTKRGQKQFSEVGPF